MSKDKQTFSNSFIHKTPQQVTEQIKLEEKKQQRENQLSYLESLKPFTFLSEDLKKTTDRFFNVNSENTLKQIIKLEQPIERKALLEQLEVSDPLVIIDGKISIDNNKLINLITSQAAMLVQNTVEKVTSSNLMSHNSVGGGGAVGIKTVDSNGNKKSILRSVNDLIIKGDGVTVTQKGKNVEINIPGASVLASDPTIDFARESTMLSLLQYINNINATVNSLVGVVVPLNYPDGIGLTGGYWSTI
jgi:hypothetical protein